MDQNKEWQQIIDEYREVPVPQSVHDRIQDAIARGKKHAARRRRAAYISTAVSGVAAVVLILVLLPNLNADMADRMCRLPFGGRFFRAVTLREYSGGNIEIAADENGAPMALGAEYDEGVFVEDEASDDFADVSPLVGGTGPEESDAVLPEPASADGMQEDADSDGIAAYAGETEISTREKQVDAGVYAERLVEHFEEENVQNGGCLELTGYEVVMDSDDWFTLIIYANESDGTEQSELRRYYNVDKNRDVIMTLGELYNGRDYVAIISDEILSQMAAKKESASTEDTAVPETEYVEFESAFTQIDENQNYYFDEDGNLVIVLDGSQVSAGTGEQSEYVIDPQLLQ